MSLGIPGWMVSDAAALRTAAGTLTGAADGVSREQSTIRTTVADAGTALGWEGRITERASATGASSQGAFARLQEDLDAGGQALLALARAMEQHGDDLRRVQADWASLQADPPQTEIEGDSREPVEVTDYPELRRREQALRDRAEPHVQSLRAADTACLGALARVVGALRSLLVAGTSSNFTRSLVPPGAWQVFQAAGVVDTDAEEALARRLPRPPTASDVRALLDQLDPARAEGFLLRHPDLLALLANDHAPVDPDDPLLAGLWEAGGTLGDDGLVSDPRSIAGIRDYWMSLSPQEQRRLRLSYPAFVGRLDGIPVEHRAGANRLLLLSAIDQEQARLALLESMKDNAGVAADVASTMPGIYPDWMVDLMLEQMTGDDFQGLVHDFGLRDQELARSQRRLDLYRSLLAPVPGLRRADVTDSACTVLPSDARALLLFDPRGDGLYAEWHGEFDAANVGIFVPGTTTDLSTIGGYAERVRTWADQPDTASITWMGVDLPDAVAADASQTRYSERGGQALLRFVEGLGMSDRTVTAVGHSAGGGIVGFADVYGMDVDRTLLVAPSGSGLDLHRPLPFPLDPWGEQPTTPNEYPRSTWDGRARDVQRFTQTAPGDSIVLAQASEDVRFWVGLPEGVGHGANPSSSDQFIRLETGRWTSGDQAGQRVEGFEAHGYVVQPGTDAWANILGVVSGGEVIPYREDGDWFNPDNVYDDPGYAGTDPVPIEELQSPWEQDQPRIMAPGPIGEPDLTGGGVA